MTCDGSVSGWIGMVKGGHESAAMQLWSRYYAKLMEVARIKLHGMARRIADEDDVVVSAFHSFLRRSRAGDYPYLCDRDGLWRLLVTITAHKACNYIRREKSQKRGGGQWATPPAFADLAHSIIHETLTNLACSGPKPEVRIVLADSLDHLLSLLTDEEMREIAVSKLQGLSNEEVAEKIQRSVPTVERRLRLIRDAWRQELLD